MVVDGPIDGLSFTGFCEWLLAPALHPGDLVVMDNLNSHKSESVRLAIESAGAEVVLLPPYSPDLNPIEQAFSKLKAHLRKVGARTFTDLFAAIGDICDLFTPNECWNFLANAGYAST